MIVRNLGDGMSLTIDENGTALTETVDGCTMPADYTFALINDFVHSTGTNYEDLQYLCLGMAAEIDKLRRGEFICRKCGLRKNSEHPIKHDF